jgi:periplasmic protein TonB
MNVKVVAIPESSGYGAIELKHFINKNTVRGFIITTSILLLLFLIYFLTGVISDAANAAPKLAPIVKLRLDELPPPESQQEDAPPPPPSQQILNSGPASRAGTPVPVPDALIKEDLKEFATMDELGRASAEGGDGVDLGGFASNIDFQGDVKVQVREAEPEPDEFIPVEKEPSLDYEKLKKSVIYPDIARRAGVEGKVIVRVLVSANGKVKKTLIEYSDSELLNEAAVKAIIDYGTFTPAIQNGQPITCWVSIPITFQLR